MEPLVHAGVSGLARVAFGDAPRVLLRPAGSHQGDSPPRSGPGLGGDQSAQASDRDRPGAGHYGYSWGGYAGWEEFNGIIRGIQLYSGLLSVSDILSEITAPQSTTAGRNLIWYLNLDPRPSDVSDKKGSGTAHNPSWSGSTSLEWSANRTARGSGQSASGRVGLLL